MPFTLRRTTEAAKGLELSLPSRAVLASALVVFFNYGVDYAELRIMRSI